MKAFLSLLLSSVTASLLALGTPGSLAYLKAVTAGGSAPAAPSGLTLTHTEDSATVGWTGNGGDGFEVWTNIAGGSFAIAGTTGPAGSGFLVDSIYNQYVDFGFNVRATNSFGQSAFLGPGYIAATPTVLIVTSVDADGVTLGWTDNSSNEDGFWVEVYNGPSGAVWANANVGIDCDNLANPVVVNSAFSPVGCGTPGGVQSELSYLKFRVFATNAFGASGYGTEVQVPPSIMITDCLATINGNDVEITWTPTGENGTLTLYRDIDGAGFTDVTGLADDGFHSVSDDAIDFAGSVLTYKLRYSNSGGNGPYSNASVVNP